MLSPDDMTQRDRDAASTGLLVVAVLLCVLLVALVLYACPVSLDPR